jgi:hypothetical protein
MKKPILVSSLDARDPHRETPAETRDAVAVTDAGNILSREVQGLVTRRGSVPESAQYNLPETFEEACRLLRATRQQCMYILTRPGAGFVIRKADL